MLMNKTIEDYIAGIAAHSPAPGGGSIGAVNGAFAASLGARVCRMTIGNNEYPQAQMFFPEIIKKLDAAKTGFLYLADAYTNAFNQVTAASEMPAAAAEDITSRNAALFSVGLEAMDILLATAESAVATAKTLVHVVRYGDTRALPDAGTGIECAHTAAHAVFMNIASNLPLLNDEVVTAEIISKRDELVRQSEWFYKNALAILQKRLDYFPVIEQPTDDDLE